MNDTGNKNRAVESECGPFHLSQLRGAQSIVFTKAPYLLSAASVAGSKEAQGPLGKYFDLTNEDDLFGAETWEEAESNMQKEACVLALGKSHVDPKSVRYLFGGDLLRQGIATSMGVEDLQIPIFGLYGACSTSGEALALAAMSVAAGYGDYMLAVTSSHFGSAEKEFRFPLGYANQRPLSAHWTVTASGAFLVGSHLNKIHSDIHVIMLEKNGGVSRAKDSINRMACERLKLGKDTVYFNSGVLLMDLNKIRKSFNKSATLDLIYRMETVLENPDQDILNILYQNDVLLLDKNIYNYQVHYDWEFANEKEKINERAIILHYVGPAKPWKPTTYHFSYEYYWKYYLEHGSSKEYKKYKNSRFYYSIINQVKMVLKSGYNRIFKK